MSDPAPRSFPTEKWVRARRDGETVVDSRRVVLVWQPPGSPYPSFAFPRGHVDAGLPAAAVEGLDGYVTVPWDAVDEWLEEEERLVAHARDPFKRIDVRRSSRHVVVRLEGEVLADSHRPSLLFETSLPTRYYLPRDDVRLEALEPSPTRTTCAYKGEAEHFARGGRDIAWSYPEPLGDMPQVRGLIAFYNERVDIELDGEPLERPRTAWA